MNKKILKNVCYYYYLTALKCVFVQVKEQYCEIPVFFTFI